MNNTPQKQKPENSVQDVDWSDFRDHIATASPDGRRKWVYPRRVGGRFFRRRTVFSWLLLVILFAGPFITLGGNPLLLINIVERKFVVLGQIFWPQDMILFALVCLVGFTCIVVFTAAFGRVWCGWACPQTVMMEMVFRKIEYWIEGDAARQRALNLAPWRLGKITKKSLKHMVFYALSFLIGNVLLSYIIGWQALYEIITAPPSLHWAGLAFMMGFSILFYAIFARFREQACTFICPYGRFQSVLLDENSIVVAYDHPRGEKRGPHKHAQNFVERREVGTGDCVDCNLCVAVCPTGIDIRNGTQMECIHCTACMDACDAVMTKVGRPPGLVRYASLNGIERGERLRLTPRLIGYCGVLAVLVSILAVMIFTRADVEVAVLRAPGSLFQKMEDGRFSNLYTVRVVNKTTRELPVELRLESPAGTLRVMGGQLVVPPQKILENTLLVEIDVAAMKSGTTPLVIGVYSNGKKVSAMKTSFIGPRD